MNFEIMMACMTDASNIYDLMKSVYMDLEDKTLFFCDNLEYVKEHVENRGFAVKVVYEGEIVASLIARFPQNDDDNLGRDVLLPEDVLCKVAHLESIVVHKKYRGYGLQDKMIKFAEKIIFDRGYTYLMATVSPANKHSLANFEKNGYEAVVVKEKYGGMMRAILLKNSMNIMENMIIS